MLGIKNGRQLQLDNTVKFTMSDDTPTDETSNACGPPLSSHDMWGRLAELLYS